MRDKILEIARELEHCEITEKEAQTKFLVLFGVTKRTLNNELKPSGFGIIVDKSKATEEYPMRGTIFPKECKFKYEPKSK